MSERKTPDLTTPLEKPCDTLLSVLFISIFQDIEQPESVQSPTTGTPETNGTVVARTAKAGTARAEPLAHLDVRLEHGDRDRAGRLRVLSVFDLAVRKATVIGHRDWLPRLTIVTSVARRVPGCQPNIRTIKLWCWPQKRLDLLVSQR